MEPRRHNEGSSKKKGLARRAKNHSLSNSLNNLHMEGRSDEKDVKLTSSSSPLVLPVVTVTPSCPTPPPDSSSPHTSQKAPDSPGDQQASPLRNFSRQSTAAVTLLPNKMNVSELSGQQQLQQQTGERRARSVQEESLSLDSASIVYVPCSDPDFIRNPKSNVRGTQSCPVAASRNSVCGGEQLEGHITPGQALRAAKLGRDSLKKLSPLLPRRAQLAPPQVKRSSSMTRLTEAFNQLHNVCLFPAHPTTMVEEQSRLNRSPSWSGYKVPGKSTTDSSDPTEDHSVPASPLQGCRSASLDELTNIGVSYGLPIISPIDAKKKNYLFGGLNSLLGASELDRYFPTRTINLFIATWNMNGKEPPANLEAFLLPDEMEHMPDMFVLGTQESGGSRTEWEVRLQATIGPSHVLFTSAIFGVLHLTIFLRRDLIWFCSVPEEATYSLRPGIAYKTKGGVGIGFQFFGTRILFINSHLTAHEEKQAYRIQNFKSISRSLDIPRLLPVKFKHKDVTHRYDCVFWLGDLNFRLAVNRDHVFERLKQGGPDTYQHLLQWDQLSQARQKGEAFSEFEEGSISFPPTFKYDPGTDHYDTSSKQRVPSYTDRILFKSKRGDITCSTYDYCPLFRTSDHKPVMGTYTCKIRPGKDDVPLAAGTFNRDVYLEALRRRRKFLYQPALRNCPVQ
ncbi:phosphatidylinositol polyphosphate 5-phosphatase type IV-like isoform X7 [Eriocheir sinensis]|uniref:phosphatidylinositol polyphosphate 5-phosphatase type IV-like isoform X7 n=1 Tax=Eriocheir sinensis TaxID=95602 RepID=UPI0021CA1B81|nr:phosphatidylinositol polyphosphate 5-phosphatase type IV-like isoform X7 [Eriocheir sinensis]